MKTRMLSIVVWMVLGMATVFAQGVKKEKITVAGNCGMCEKRIETAAKLVEGVNSAEWNKETKILELQYNPEKTDIHTIEIAIAKAGHDTKMHKASDEAYAKLPACCKYERLKEDSGDKK